MNRHRALFVLLIALLSPLAVAETLLVGNKSADTVSLIDLASGETVAVAATGRGPHEVAVSDDGQIAVVTNYGTREEPGNTLTVIEVEAGKAVGTIDLGKHTRPHGIVWLPDNRKALVTTEGSKKLLLVNVYAGTIEKAIPTGQITSHMLAYDRSGRRAYVSNMGSGSVSLLNVNHGELLAFKSSGRGAEGIALSQDGARLWVTNRDEDTVSLFDARFLKLLQKVEVGGFPIRAEITPDDQSVLVTSARSGTLTIIDQRSAEVMKTVDLGLMAKAQPGTLLADQFSRSSIPIGVELSPSGDRAWIAHAGIDRVQELETKGWTQTRLLVTGREPDAMGFSALKVKPAD